MAARRLTVAMLAFALTACMTAAVADYKSDLMEKVRMYGVSQGKFAPLYPAFAKQMVEDYGITKGVCVDVGSGPASFAMELAKITEMKVYALDIDSDAIRLASILVDEAGLTGRVIPIEGDAQDMPFRTEFADLVFSRGSIPFWPDREAGVRECYRILKPGGVAYVGGGFTRILPPEVREPLARERAASTMPAGFQPIDDLDRVALRAGIPPDQFRVIREPIAGWWLEMRKPQDHTAWYRRWTTQLGPWHEAMAEQTIARYNLRSGRCLELGWGAGSLALPLVQRTKLSFIVGGYDADAAKVANARAAQSGYSDRVQAIACDPEHLPFDDNTFDYVFGHAGPAIWRNPDKVFREISRVLRPRGVALIGNGCPMQTGKDSEMKFRELAKDLREAPDAPTDGFKQCAEKGIFDKWIAASGANGRLVSVPDIHNQWVEIRK